MDWSEKEIRKIAEIKARKYPATETANNIVFASDLYKNTRELASIFGVNHRVVEKAVAKYRKQKREDRNARILELYRAGKTKPEICRILNISEGCVKHIFKQKGIVYSNHILAGKKRKQRDLYIKKLRKEGKSLRQIGKVVSLGAPAIHRILNTSVKSVAR